MGRTATACTKNIILQKRKVLIFLNTNKCNISECNTSTLQNTDVLRCQKIFASQFFCKQAFTVKDLLTTTAQGGSFPKHTDSPKRHLKLQIITSDDFKKKSQPALLSWHPQKTRGVPYWTSTTFNNSGSAACSLREGWNRASTELDTANESQSA